MFEKVKARVEEMLRADNSPGETDYIDGLRWDETPIVLSYGNRSVVLYSADEPPGMPGYTGYAGVVEGVLPGGLDWWISGERDEAFALALEWLETGVVPNA